MGKSFDVKYLPAFFLEILSALPITVLITAVAFIAGLLIGFACALVKIKRIPVLSGIVRFYTSFIRGTPLLVQLYIFYYGVPQIIGTLNEAYGWQIDISRIPAIYYVFIAYSLNTGAYLTETIRSALEAVDIGQTEAALSVGMTNAQLFRRIILPQAFLTALPNLGNSVISLLKDTSLAFSVTVMELIGSSKLVASRGFHFMEAYLDAAIIYWITCILIEIAANRFEKHLKRKRGLA